MKLGISSIYTEVGVNFEISHKVDNLIRKLLTDNILIPYKLDSINKDWFLELIISTKSDLKKVEVNGPDFHKEDKFVIYTLWLPYNRITEADNYLEEYLDSLFEALSIVFDNYNISHTPFIETLATIKQIVINNDEYVFIEERIDPPNLSDLNL